jgi:K+-sensing histidine kinase KdpD
MQRNLGTRARRRNPVHGSESFGTTFAPAWSMSASHVPYVHVLNRYALVLATATFATSVALTIASGMGLRAIGLLVFLLAVLAAAWFGGTGPCIVVAFASALAVALFFLSPIGSLAVEAPP